MKRLVTPSYLANIRVLYAFVLASVVFFPLIFTTPPYLYLLMNNLIFSAATINAYVFWPAAKVVLTKRMGDTDYADLLGAGIFNVFLSLALILGYTIVLQFMQIVPIAALQAYETYYLPQAYFRYIGLVGAWLYLVSRPFIGDGSPNINNMKYLMAALVAGFAITGLQLYFLL